MRITNIKPTLTGAVPVIPTPFQEDESIDYDALASCIEFAARVGVSAVCLPAYASEFYKLSESEREQIVETAVRAAAGRVSVILQDFLDYLVPPDGLL
jgi:dihydrodipicolinate synthase/N-acetylneuraminate lyase